PFLPLHPRVYAQMLAAKIAKHSARVFLINTGWTGGPYGEGKRIDLAVTRSIVSAAVAGDLDDVATRTHPVFGLEVPEAVKGVDPAILDPRNTWKDPSAYDIKAKELAQRFDENYATVTSEVHQG
ncbi:MAG: phosphoenolpyruvate carboxykinase (ATP), partial [Actinomycetota bacterium]